MPSNYSHPFIVSMTYEAVLPILCGFGILGNLLSVLVLRKKKFECNMVVILRGLAWSDIAFLICTIQVCYFVNTHDYIHTLEDGIRITSGTKSQENYMFNVLPSLCNLFGSCSDLIVTFLTVNRVLVMRKINRLQREIYQKWKIRAKMAAILVVSILFQIPFYFQYDIEACGGLDSNSSSAASPLRPDWEPDSDCWSIQPAVMVDGMEWPIFTVLHLALIRLLPIFLVAVMNVWMYWKLRSIIKARAFFKDIRRARVNSFRVGSEVANNDVTTISAMVEREEFGSTDDDDLSQETRSTESPKGFYQVTKIRRRRVWLWKVLSQSLRKNTAREIKRSRILLLIVVTHLILATPFKCMNIIYVFVPNSWANIPAKSVSICITHILLVLNYSINFLLYCVGNKRVREEACTILFQCRHLHWWNNEQRK